MRVLVVEDEVKMAALLRRGLSEEGLTVDVAGEGERAAAQPRGLGALVDHQFAEADLPEVLLVRGTTAAMRRP